MKSLFFLFLTSIASAADLQPLLAVPDQVVLQDDFSKAGPLDKKAWAKRQGTQWTVEDGVLRGMPSTPEFQASKEDHKGLEPRLSAPITPAQFIAKFSLRFDGGPTLYAKHVCFAKPVPSGGNGLGLAGPKDGTVELDNVTLWNIKADAQSTWAAKRDTLPKFAPVTLSTKKNAK